MASKIKHQADIERVGVQDSIIDKRAVAVGLIVAIAGIGGAMAWRLATKPNETLRKPEEFQFSLSEHNTEKFDLRDPVRQFTKERPTEAIDALPQNVIREERPNIQISETPTEVVTQTEVIKSKQVEFNTEKIEIGGTTMVDTPDAPLEITQVSETTTYAINPIAADTMAPADIFKYDNPSPRDRLIVSHINAAPRAGRPTKMLPKAFGDQDAPTTGKLGPMSINLFGTGDFFRTMDRSGTIRARSAVDSALHWLAMHQDASGAWLCEKYDGEESGNLASTALATLALMGGGNTTARGEYRRNVTRAIDYIIKNQNAKGLIAQKGNNLYTHAICTIALCESYGRAKDERVLKAATKAIEFCQVAVNADGGWRYAPNTEASDTSVTAWFVQALKTAKMAGVPYKSTTLSQSLMYLDTVTDEGGGPNTSGKVGYMAKGNETSGSTALVAAGMLIRQVNGTGVKAPVLVRGSDLLRKDPPVWRDKNFYYWYYASYAMHNMGGEHRLWWSQKTRDMLLENQAKDGDNAGSWDPKGDRWAKHGGRVYTTSLGALCLEVYYRYSDALNTFGTAPDLDEMLLDSGSK